MISVNINGRWTLQLPEHRQAQWAKPWEAARIDSMHANLNPGMLVYDIGSEEGDMPALWASWCCDVVLVEPGQRVWHNIRAIFDANKLKPRGWFVGFAGDRDEIPQAAQGWQTARNGWPRCAYGEVIDDHDFRNVYERPDIPQTTIDTLAIRFGQPDAITMDIEGAEYVALRGAHQVLRKGPLLWISVHPTFMAETYHNNVSALWELLREYGYKWRLIDYDHELHVFAWVSGKHDPVLPE